jgi:hypothetical protein
VIHDEPESHVVTAAEVDHLVRPGDVEREGLLAEHVLARGRRRDDCLPVEVVRHADRDRIHIVPLEQPAVVLEGVRDIEGGGEGPGAVGVRVGHGDEPDVLVPQAPHPPSVSRGHPAATDDAVAEGSCPRLSLPTSIDDPLDRRVAGTRSHRLTPVPSGAG